MRLYSMVSGILLILPIIDFAVAAPVRLQEKRQAGADVVHIPEDATTMLGKRGEDGVLFKLFSDPKNFADLKASEVSRPPSWSPPGPSRLGSTPDPLRQPWSPPGPSRLGSSPLRVSPSRPASSTMSSGNRQDGLMGEQALPNPIASG
jgi:hypothetical protein